MPVLRSMVWVGRCLPDYRTEAENCANQEGKDIHTIGKVQHTVHIDYLQSGTGAEYGESGCQPQPRRDAR